MEVESNENHGVYHCHVPVPHELPPANPSASSRSQAQEGAVTVWIKDNDTQHNDTVTSNSTGTSAFFWGFFGVPHTYLSTNESKFHSNFLSKVQIEEKVHPDTYLSSPSTTPKAAWATLVTLGSYQPIICPAANTVWRCTDCKKIKHQQLVLNPLLQMQFLHSFILFTTMLSQ